MAGYRAFYIMGPSRPGWKDKLRLVAAGAVGIVVLGAALILSLSLLLILIPVGIVVYLFRGRILRSLFGAAQRRAQPQPQPEGSGPQKRAADGVVIETDYRIVEPREPGSRGD